MRSQEWMGHICAAQQGIPADQRESKLRVFDVYNDALATKMKEGGQVALDDVIKHPVGVRYFMQFLASEDKHLVKLAKCNKSISKYKKAVVPEKKLKKAKKIFKKYVHGNPLVPKPTQSQIADQVEQFDFLAQNMFGPIEDLIREKCEAVFDKFLHGDEYQTLKSSCGPKMMVVTKDKEAGSTNHKLDGTVIIGRSRENEDADEYIRLEGDKKVSREHCKLDCGPLAVLVTDLGSSKGTRLDSKDGKKVMAKIILPGQSLHIGGFALTYQIGEAPSSKKRSSGFFGKLFGKK
jgi:hypothetical protein